MAIHPEQLRLDLAGELPRGQRRIYDILFPWLTRKVRQGLPAYLMPSRAWLAQQARVSLSTVTRAFANMQPPGPARHPGAVSQGQGQSAPPAHQPHSLAVSPAGGPRSPEVVKVAHQTRKTKKEDSK